MFCVFPFGFSMAHYIFTKVTRVWLRYWRMSGVKCQLYTDNGSGGHKTREEAKLVVQRIQSDLRQAGFVPNDNKVTGNRHKSWR